MGAFLITGTDTSIGKSFITYNLALALRERGIKVGCFKPVETFVLDQPQDGLLLSKATGQSLEEIVPVRFKLPLAPYSATIEEGKDFSLEELKERFTELKNRYEVLLVEGAGGLAVPLKKNYTYCNLALDWGIPILIVARAGLGTINHTFLTWFYAREKGVKAQGIVLNGFTGEDVSEETNPRVIEEMTGLKPVLIKKHEGLEITSEEKLSLLELVGF